MLNGSMRVDPQVRDPRRVVPVMRERRGGLLPDHTSLVLSFSRMTDQAASHSTTEVFLTSQIKQKALQLGFAKVGIARAENLSTELDHLQEWLARGYQGEMKWM